MFSLPYCKFFLFPPCYGRCSECASAQYSEGRDFKAEVKELGRITHVSETLLTLVLLLFFIFLWGEYTLKCQEDLFS